MLFSTLTLKLNEKVKHCIVILVDKYYTIRKEFFVGIQQNTNVKLLQKPNKTHMEYLSKSNY